MIIKIYNENFPSNIIIKKRQILQKVTITKRLHFSLIEKEKNKYIVSPVCFIFDLPNILINKLVRYYKSEK